ncbi:MHO_4530 family protein [Mycoplasmopsis cricetuli]|uniref:MHO_4530 family protein n=1 Tax=Mycoplasmopsis cricetuli TaxID=171283 RepID=UPI00047146E3|nr:hypothetical protein [Mycoplasmopsis cricetuli]
MIYILIIITGIILFILIAFVVLFLIVLFYFRSFSGVIFFKIDNINKRVIRISDKYYLLSTIFDAKKTKFQTFNYIPMGNFWTFFDANTIIKIKKFIELSNEHEDALEIKITQDNLKKNKINLTFLEKIILFLDHKFQYETNYVLKIFTKKNGIFYCSINWQKNKLFNNDSSKNVIQNKKHFKNIFLNNIVVAFALKPYYYINKIQGDEIIDIYDHFLIPYKKTIVDIRDGFIYFVFKKGNKYKYRFLLENINKINRNSQASKYFLAATIFTEGKIKTLEEENILINKIKYSLYHILNNRNEFKKYINLPKNIVQNSEFKTFVNNYNEYVKKNNDEEFQLILKKIKTYQKHNDSIISLLSVFPIGMDIQEVDFFLNIPYLNYLYESKWYEYIKNSNYILIQKNKNNITSNMVKVSQEVFLKSEIQIANISPTYLVYAYSNLFNYEKLQEKINFNHNFNVYTALYVDTINKPLINIISYTKLKLIVIGKKITSNLNRVEVFYDCINIVELAKKNNIKIVYEDPNLNLDPLIVEKANIKAYYLNSNYKKI